MSLLVLVPWNRDLTRLILRRHKLRHVTSIHARNGLHVTTTIEDLETGRTYTMEDRCARDAIQKAANKALRDRG